MIISIIIINITPTSRKSPTERKEIMSLFNKYEDEDEDEDSYNPCQYDNISGTRTRKTRFSASSKPTP